MSEKELKERLYKDAKSIGLPISSVMVDIRPFSKTYYGNYVIRTKKVRIYPYKNTIGSMYKYERIMETFIHEMVHHIQHTDPKFIRKRGVMHDPQFWKLYNYYVDKFKPLYNNDREEEIPYDVSCCF